MTFCAECKQDICRREVPDGCCGAARLYGALLFAKSFDRHEIHIASEHAFVVDHLEECLVAFGIRPDTILRGQGARERWLRITDVDTIDRILSDLGYSGDELSLRLKGENLRCERCASAFAAGCFLTGGTVSTPSSGYHLEFSSHKRGLITDIAAFLAEQGFSPKETARGYSRVLYFKDSSQIEDMLTFMGAHNASLELMNTKIMKEIVNGVNRRTNCESANIDKIVASSVRDREAIQYLLDRGGEDMLSEDLLAVARLRIENPELSLEQLGASLDPPLSKSGVNHRLRRLRAEAQQLKEQQTV